MNFSRRMMSVAILLGAGIATGVFLQHRWPLGRLRAELANRPRSAGVSLDAIARLPRARRLVIVVAGQSNASNHGSTRAAAGGRVFAFAHGALFAAVDPLPGGDGDGGSIWTRLGAKLAMTDHYDAIVFAVVAQGSTRAAGWAPRGSCFARFSETLRQLASIGLPADGIFWQQGETESAIPTASGREYVAALESVMEAAQEIFPEAIFFVAQSTFSRDVVANAQIPLAQAAVQREPRVVSGPNLDQLGAEFRSDGVHFNERGLSAAAGLWFEACQVAFARGPSKEKAP
jgi:hypothetical protein